MQRLLVVLLTDVDARHASRTDPGAFARSRIESPAAAALVAALDPSGLDAAAGMLERKAASSQTTDAATEGVVATATGSSAERQVASIRDHSGAPRAMSAAIGCTFRPALLPSLFDQLRDIEVWEHIIDWYAAVPVKGAQSLREFADVSPLTLHSLAISVGSPPSEEQAGRLEVFKALIEAAGVDHLSDHLAMSRAGDVKLPHFVPLWRVEEQLELLAENVERIQDAVGVQLVLENPASQFDPGGEMSTAELFNALCARTGCGVLLDLENLRVNELNGFVDGTKELAALDLHNVVGVHLAGGSDPDDEGLTWDTHEQPIASTVFGWLDDIAGDLDGCRSIIIERDDRFDAGGEVVEDLRTVRALLRPSSQH